MPRAPVPRFTLSIDGADAVTRTSASPRQPETPSRFVFEDEPFGEFPMDEDEDEDEEEPGGSTVIDDFPLDAFIIPEGPCRLPTGLREADRRQRQRAHELAARLESLATRLRREGYSALARQTAHGDPVDALIAGILAGYLAAVED